MIRCDLCKKDMSTGDIHFVSSGQKFCSVCMAKMKTPSKPVNERSIQRQPLSARDRQAILLLGVAIVVAIVIALGFWIHSASSPRPSSRPAQWKSARDIYGDEFCAWIMAKQFVEDRLKSPGTAEYGWQSQDECVTDLGGQQYRIEGWVDAQNSFGAKMRSDFTLTIQYQGNRNWHLVEGPIIQPR